MQKYFTLVLLVTIGSLLGVAAAMDQVRVETRADKAIEEFRVTGKGVLVALMDRGIDWRNADFRNEDGSTRIQYIFDLTDDQGAAAPNNAYRMGTLYTKQEIDAALNGGKELPHRDAVGHGTTTAAIACGNGRNSDARKYRGLAPEASILVVKITSDGVPAHDDEPAEAAYYDEKRLPVAIDFIRDKARELRMPCVMVLNIGSQGGPTDGTSELCRKIDATVGPGKRGLIFVCGPGDDGGRPNRAAGEVKRGESVDLKLVKEAESAIYLDLWYPGEDRFAVSIETPSGKHGPFRSPQGADERVTEETQEFVLCHNAGKACFYGAANKKREIWIKFNGVPGTYSVVLDGKQVRKGRFDATLSPNPPAPTWPPFNRFLNHVAPGSIWDGATARHNICPGDYVLRTHWLDIDHQPQFKTDQGNVGELWRGSSVGPTFDGRLGVDFCAPGDTLFTTYAPRSHWATFRSNLINDGTGMYGAARAVSAANPLTAGIIALMLQIDPQLDAAAAKQILQRTARADEFTGKTPNPTWGCGKIDAYAALQMTSEKRTKKGSGRAEK